MKGLVRRGVWSAAVRLGLQVYDPEAESLSRLDELTEYELDPRPVPDKRATTAEERAPDLTIVPEALAHVLDVERFRGARVLEVGPKYGLHARWIDEQLQPAELVFSDFASDRHLHEGWVHDLRAPHRFVYGDLRTADELLELEPFDLVFFLGVLYHSANHLELLRMLNRVTKPGGTMLLESTIDTRGDAVVRYRWPRTARRPRPFPRFPHCACSLPGRAGGRRVASRTTVRERPRRCSSSRRPTSWRRRLGSRPAVAAHRPDVSVR